MFVSAEMLRQKPGYSTTKGFYDTVVEEVSHKGITDCQSSYKAELEIRFRPLSHHHDFWIRVSDFEVEQLVGRRC
jgi:hypothetical protein